MFRVSQHLSAWIVIAPHRRLSNADRLLPTVLS